MAKPRAFTNAGLKELGVRGYNVQQADAFLEMTVNSAAQCDIGNVLLALLETSRAIDKLGTEVLQKRKYAATDETLLVAQAHQDTLVEVLATLKAKQCRCG